MKKILLATLLFLCVIPAVMAGSAPKLEMAGFGLLPVLHEGRIKPLDSFARIALREISGEETINGMDAPEWLANAFFDPANAADSPIFEISSNPLKERLGLPAHNNHFTLAELIAGFEKNHTEIQSLQAAPPEKLTGPQTEILDIYKRALLYGAILRSFSSIQPLAINIPEKYDSEPPSKSFADFFPAYESITADIKKLVTEKGDNPAHYNNDEKTLAEFAFALEQMHIGGLQPSPLKIIHSDTSWLSPWEYVLQHKNPVNPEFSAWNSMLQAYRAHDNAAWKAAINTAQSATPQTSFFRLERLYNQLEPFRLAMAFYALGLIILGAEIYRKTNRSLFPLICLGLGIFFQTGGLLSRILILQRPPVGTLYESLLFVSLVCVVAASALYLRRKNFSFLFAGMTTGSVLLFLAPSLLQQGESMEMLVAVLNTSFWLTTHVLCITAGYGISILAALTAHACLALRLTDAPSEKFIPLQDGVYKISLVALLLTAIGTVLGGIWADQSWGRFWGWDPKENGALLIVLWIIWMQHGRIAGRLNPPAFLACAAFLNVVVALAWFGVNLLSVGLHSYGFISGIALALTLFCSLETTIIIALWRLNVQKTGGDLA